MVASEPVNGDIFNATLPIYDEMALVSLDVLQCPTGYYGGGQSLGATCTKCPEGSTTKDPGSTTVEDCNGEGVRLLRTPAPGLMHSRAGAHMSTASNLRREVLRLCFHTRAHARSLPHSHAQCACRGSGKQAVRHPACPAPTASGSQAAWLSVSLAQALPSIPQWMVWATSTPAQASPSVRAPQRRSGVCRYTASCRQRLGR